MRRTPFDIAIATIAVAIALLVAGQLYLFLSAGAGAGDGTPTPAAIVVFWIGIETSVVCLLTVPYATIALLKHKSHRTSRNLLVVGAGILLLVGLVAYVVAMFM